MTSTKPIATTSLKTTVSTTSHKPTTISTSLFKKLRKPWPGRPAKLAILHGCSAPTVAGHVGVCQQNSEEHANKVCPPHRQSADTDVFLYYPGTQDFYVYGSSPVRFAYMLTFAWPERCDIKMAPGGRNGVEVFLPLQRGQFILVFGICEACDVWARQTAETNFRASLIEAQAALPPGAGDRPRLARSAAPVAPAYAVDSARPASTLSRCGAIGGERPEARAHLLGRLLRCSQRLLRASLTRLLCDCRAIAAREPRETRARSKSAAVRHIWPPRGCAATPACVPSCFWYATPKEGT